MSMGYDDGHRGPRIPPQLIIGAIIALIGLFSYFALPKQTNPYTGRAQRVTMTVDQEMALGLEAAPRMAAKMGGAADPRRDPDARRVDQVGQRLVARTDVRQSPYISNFHFYLLNDDRTINAFALPGGQVFITRALYDKLQSEDQLAGVLGHEIGHVVGRHSAEQMAKGRLGQMLATAVGVGASDNRGGGRGASTAAMMANQMIQLSYGRGDESESDRLGMKFMNEAGYNPHGQLEVMEILKKASQGGSPPEFLSSHPLPQTRIDDIQEILDRDYPQYAHRRTTDGPRGSTGPR